MLKESVIYDYKYFCYRLPSHDVVKGLRRLTNSQEAIKDYKLFVQHHNPKHVNVPLPIYMFDNLHLNDVSVSCECGSV